MLSLCWMHVFITPFVVDANSSVQEDSDLLTSEPQYCWDRKIRLRTFSCWWDTLYQRNKDEHNKCYQHWFHFWMSRLIRGARSSTMANGKKWWRWQEEMPCKIVGVICAFSELKRQVYYPVGAPIKEEGGYVGGYRCIDVRLIRFIQRTWRTESNLLYSI